MIQKQKLRKQKAEIQFTANDTNCAKPVGHKKAAKRARETETIQRLIDTDGQKLPADGGGGRGMVVNGMKIIAKPLTGSVVDALAKMSDANQGRDCVQLN